MKSLTQQADAVDVFLSYKRGDRERCVEIHRKLVALRLNVWFDAVIDPGTSFSSEIQRKLNSARAVLVLWSPLAIDSDWVVGEASRGRERGVLCSVLVEPTHLPVPFNQVQTPDLTRRGFADDDPEWLSVLRRIGDLVGRPGLEEYSRLLARSVPEELDAWSARWPDDPLVIHSGTGDASNAARTNAAGPPMPDRARPDPARRPVGWLLAGAVVAGAAAAYLRFGIFDQAWVTRTINDSADSSSEKKGNLPATLQPAREQPVTEQHVAAQPAVAEPASPQPVVAEPVTASPPPSPPAPEPAATARETSASPSAAAASSAQSQEAPAKASAGASHNLDPKKVVAGKPPAPSARPGTAEREKRDSERRASSSPVDEKNVTTGTRGAASDCGTILRKFSLGETITPEEKSFLKSSCKNR